VHLNAEEAVDFAADLVQRRATALADAGRYDDAIAVYDEDVRGYRARLSGRTGVPVDPQAARRQTLHLAKVLMEVGSLHARMRRGEQALGCTTEAVATARGAGPAESGMNAYMLARVLWGYAWVRAGLGVELPQALQAVQEAEAVLRHLSTDRSPNLAPAVAADLPVLRSFALHLRERCGTTGRHA
jgi:hypothetical protein